MGCAGIPWLQTSLWSLAACVSKGSHGRKETGLPLVSNQCHWCLSQRALKPYGFKHWKFVLNGVWARGEGSVLLLSVGRPGPPGLHWSRWINCPKPSVVVFGKYDWFHTPYFGVRDLRSFFLLLTPNLQAACDSDSVLGAILRHYMMEVQPCGHKGKGHHSGDCVVPSLPAPLP